MKTKLILSIIAILVVIVFSCKKEPEIPTGSNKIEIGETTTDTIEYHTAKIVTTVTSTGGNEITQHGHCWSIEQEPTIVDRKTALGKFTQPKTYTSELTELSDNTTYYIRSYLIYKNGTVYGDEQNIRTLKTGIPVVSTSEVSNITLYTAECGGNAIADSGLLVITKGVCWNTDSTVNIENNIGLTNEGDSLGTFSSVITELQEGINYYAVAYSTNEMGTSYGLVKEFSTVAITLPVVITATPTNILTNTTTSGGVVTSNGNGSVTARGVCWNTTSNPTLENSLGHTINGSGTGEFTSNISGLTDNTKYYVTAFATNEKGTSYGEVMEFTTLEIILPEVTTSNISNLTMYSAQSGGNVTSDGNGIITARGICWSTTSNPTITDNHTSDGSGIGAFESSITGLSPTTQYYARAYATNSVGTAYGNEISFTTLSNVILPSVTTDEAINISQTTATGGGNVTSDGGGTVSAKGICWSTSPNPSLSNSYSIDGTGTGIFTSNITGLTQNTTYYIRAYATNAEGTAYGNQISFNTLADPVVPTVTTATATNITQTTANCGGDVTSDGGADVTARGVCWSTQQDPDLSDPHTSDGTGTGIFTSLLTGLNPNTFYYVRAYATNSVGTTYGNEQIFMTLDTSTIPTVTTAEAMNITQTEATSGGTVHANGGATVTTRGVCYSTSQNPTLADEHTTNGNGLGVFVSILTSLTPNTQYYVRAYATNSEGTAYGNEITFVALSDVTLPTVTTDEATNITQTTATSGGEVTDDGGADVTARGVCWSISNNPTLADSYTTDGSGTGTFVSLLTGLTQNTTYYVRSYATNSEGTAYGNEITFVALSDVTLPTVTTDEATNITQTTATSGGEVTDDGGADVTARGVCWSISSNPTLADNYTTDGSGTGAFVSELTGLTENTLYYVRAYATNSEGTAYGDETTFNTLMDITLPTVTTDDATNIAQTTATSGGNVTDDGGADVTARGVCWGISSNPTLDDDYTTDGAGTGTFISELTGLTESTQYFVRAYASNSVGTAYGNEISFSTLVYIWQCGDILSYEGQDYTTVLIGTQCWFKENLNVGIRINNYEYPSDNGQIEKFCYDDDDASCDTYGGLYQWDEMMEYSGAQGAQGICPTGWHIPTDDEWKTLEGTVDSQYGVGDSEWDGTGERGFDAGKNLKSTSGWNNNGNGTDIYGFTALPSGAFSMSQQVFFSIGETTWFWTSSINVWSIAWQRTLHFSYDGVGRDDTVLTTASRSLRCLKN